ncbi:MAG TPA: cupin domain-containing protein [Leptospiraceae bacterium]|nr:cupin domain-containing protein [Leptospiraceae bacterium]HNF24863.1 cupin domain-containing protein [Leptospiraceae bacterium]HNI95983.1 cupin domain-containing protein [Leptospiraceae bacterium]HNM01894.1 cupin domain-containing protein [Leptospiraceae bacterium]HNN03892.1 cupin domain-containing protein [Leptospiraceae bacterium]
MSATAVYFFTVSALIFSGCNKKETSGPAEPALGPVERLHMDDLSVQSIKFHNGRTADYKILLDKPEMSVVLFSLKKGDEIPAHIHSADKAVYIYGGKEDIFAQNKMNSAMKGDTVYVPKGSVTSVRNTNDETAKVFLFFPTGPFLTIKYLGKGKNYW